VRVATLQISGGCSEENGLSSAGRVVTEGRRAVAFNRGVDNVLVILAGVLPMGGSGHGEKPRTEER